MAHVIVSDIDDLRYLTFPEERNETSTGELALDGRLVEIYKKNYSNRPKTQEEADLLGELHFNGLSSSIPYLSVSKADGKNIVVAHLAPTRYLFSQAMKDFTKAHPDASQEMIEKVSPAMANVSLLVPVKVKDKYYLLSQLKGKAIGSGQIQAALVAGGVNANDLNGANPFLNALKHETSQEVGLDLSSMDYSSFLYIIDEREIGNLNLVAVARNQNLTHILDVYEKQTKKKLKEGESLEVGGLAKIDLEGLSLVPVEGGRFMIKNVLSYIPSKEGLIEETKSRIVRPYTEAIVNYLQDPQNIETLIYKAGF